MEGADGVTVVLLVGIILREGQNAEVGLAVAVLVNRGQQRRVEQRLLGVEHADARLVPG